MLSVNSLKNLYFLPEVHDMRYNAESMLAMLKSVYGRDPYKGDIYIFLSKDRRQVRMVHYENNAFHTQTKTYKKGYKFMKIAWDEYGRKVYEMSWKDLVALLECPVTEVLRLRSDLLGKAE
ncbi:MAG: IS66 family insertion sequence element accessory protein TnpB [Muribaculaceae bacterium]|nr:IS66 family insertion sequence element accessory protein TnpB [Muribaculaceae bacterium]